MPYQAIEHYGIIGDLHTIALVCKTGAIDWLCWPHFDSPSIFAGILDDEKGGTFHIGPLSTSGEITYKQLYWPDTNVLVTRFLSGEGVGEIIDIMPVDGKVKQHHEHRLIRYVKAVRGSMALTLSCRPAFNYGRDAHQVEMTDHGVCFRSPSLALELESFVPLHQTGAGVEATFRLEEGQSATFVLQNNTDEAHAPLSQAQTEDLFHQTVHYWRSWLSQSTYTGRWREMVQRSALVLKLLTFLPTGAIVAAPTTSLPEALGGERNWDYRYTWLRDAAFTIYGLLRIGFTEEAAGFMRWIEARCQELNPDGSLQIMYGIDGRHTLTEETLDHLAGYKDSRPVRIGNGAYDQLQLDIYGELLDSIYLYNKHGAPISYDLWVQLRRLVNWVCDNWKRTDEGIWEVRSGQQHFVYSKLMCWVALDRGLRLADKRSFPADRERWLKVRDEIFEDIMVHGWNEDRKAFVQYYGCDALDAANLMMPLVFFVAPNDPRMMSTLEAINQPPSQGGLVANSLVYRYNLEHSRDGLSGEEGTFNICTFWLVEALTRAGQVYPECLQEARLMFERMLGYANHVGLYAEETGNHGEALGNFPQAFTHLALISAAFNLDRMLGRRG